jgi:hypothetical protein
VLVAETRTNISKKLAKKLMYFNYARRKELVKNALSSLQVITVPEHNFIDCDTAIDFHFI